MQRSYIEQFYHHNRTAMSPSTHHRGGLATVTIALFLTLSSALPSSAQFSLESMLPAPASENVPTTQPIVLTFSQPIDTTLKFGGEEGFFIAAQLAPDTGPPLGYSLNDARTELSVNVLLAPNTQYWIVLVGAKSESGQDLDHPYAWTFSTGTLANGSTSGTVSFPGDTPENAVVGLFDADFFDSLLGGDGEDDEPQFHGLTVAGSDGSYTMDYVPSGTFLPVSFRDVDLNGEPDIGVEGEGLGFHDPDSDLIPNVIVVADGGSVSDVDLELHSGASTSQTNYESALDVAANVYGDAALSGVLGPDVTPDGYSPLWLYTFYSSSSDVAVDVAFFYDFLLDADLPIYDGGRPFDATSILPDDLIDSSEALEAAEVQGGAAYRDQFGISQLTALLFNIDLEGGAGKDQSLAELQPVWFVTYSANELEPLLIMVDAITGMVVTGNDVSELPVSNLLLESYPNPSAGSVSVAYEMETTDDVEISVSNALGQTVRHLVRDVALAGQHVAHWDGTDDAGLPVAAGAYWLRLITKDRLQSTMVVISR